MNFIITGGAGFIGSHLTEFLLEKGHAVKIIDNLHGGKLDNLSRMYNQIEFYKSNILNYKQLEKIAKDVDGIFHQAALTSVQDSFLQLKEYKRVNIMGTENVLRVAKDLGIKVVFASSASVYGDPEKIPIKENLPMKPLNPYGRTKVKAEDLVSKYSEMGVSSIVLRYFNVYGMRQNPSYAGVITKFLACVKDQNPITIHGKGEQVRDFVYVGDVANANFLAMKNKIRHAVINIGSGIPVSINDLAKMIVNISNSKIELFHDKPQKGDVKLSHADISLAKKMLKWQPKTHLKDWLEYAIKNVT